MPILVMPGPNGMPSLQTSQTVFHIVCFAGLIERDYLINVNPDSLRHKNIKAYRSESRPIINGILDLGEWVNCSPNSEFFNYFKSDLGAK